MGELTSLNARRWSKIVDPGAHSVRDMLVEAIRQIDAGEVAMDHAIIAYSTDCDDGGVDLGWFQAGNQSHLGQVGLLCRLTHIMGTLS